MYVQLYIQRPGADPGILKGRRVCLCDDSLNAFKVVVHNMRHMPHRGQFDYFIYFSSVRNFIHFRDA